MAFRKPKDYDDVKVGEYRTLPAGGYVCRIMKAEETKSSKGKDMLKIAFDICDGDYTGFFMESFTNRKAAAEGPGSVKWDFSGTKWILFYDSEGNTNRDFKAFCTALEDSGTEVWRGDVLDVNNLKDATVGIIFRREEHEYNGKTSWRTVPFRFRSVRAIEAGDFRIPEDKPIVSNSEFAAVVDSFSAAEDDIPF